MINFKKFGLIIFVLVIVSLPSFAFAQNTCSSNVREVGDIICKIGSILKAAVPLLITLGVIYFIWGVVQYVVAGGEEARKKGRDRIIYGLIGLVVVFAMWGLVWLVMETFGVGPGNAPPAPELPQGSGGCSLGTTLGDLMTYVTCLISNSVIPLIVSLAIAMFTWGVAQYVINSDEESKKQKGKQFMIWGIIGLAVMFSVWGLVRIVGQTFGIKYAIPQLETK